MSWAGLTWPGPLEFAFMRHAFLAVTCISIASSLIGYFVVLRRQAFAAHALNVVGFAGAAGASLIGVPPLVGLFVFVIAVAFWLSAVGENLTRRDVSAGMIQMFSLGLGILFVNLYSANANAAIGILFGSVLGISTSQLETIAVVSGLVLLALIAMFRPLRFASLNTPAARARGLPVGLISTGFLLMLAFMCAVSVPVIGALLSFAIFIGPAAAAQAWTQRMGRGMALTVALALAQGWAGLTISWYVNIPPTSCIASLSFACFALAWASTTSLWQTGRTQPARAS